MDEMEPIDRLSRDILKAGVTLTVNEARFLVDAYYILQRARITAGSQMRSLNKSGEPHTIIDWLGAQNKTLENQVKSTLDRWSDGNEVSVWAKSIVGIGPVISAGLKAHIDIEKAPTVGHIWRFAGLDPTLKWEAGEKRPYNAKLKSLCAYKLGESFVKVQNHEGDIYGRVFAKRRMQEEDKNEAGLHVEESAAILKRKNFKKDTEAYKAYIKGKFPPAHLHARARRYAVKLFLAHYHAIAYFSHFRMMPPVPYVFQHMEGHVDFIAPPNSEMIEGLPDALEAYKKLIAVAISAPRLESEPEFSSAPEELSEPTMVESATEDE
jgi:hypothetical protein